MLRIEGLHFNYGRKNILNNINLALEKGEFISIIGSNGSGKTTLINCINGMNDNYSGNIYYLGKNLKDYSIVEHAKNFAVISQMQKIKFPFTCFEAVYMGRHPYKNRISSIDINDIEIITEVMKTTDTYKFADHLITQISGGEFQRVMFARALVQKPKVLILDEAFSSMDIAYKVNALKILKKMSIEDGLTVVSVIHDINLAYKFSDKICMLKNGRIVKYGKPDEIVNEKTIKDTFNIDVEEVEDLGFFIR